MSDDTSRRRDGSESKVTDEVGTSVSSTYKVLGEFEDAGGAGVLGKNTAGSGTPIGVEGTAPNAGGGYGLSTPDDARVGGTIATDSVLTISVNGDEVLLVEANEGSGIAGQVRLGHSENQSLSDGTTISGGGFDDGETFDHHYIGDDAPFATIGGGRHNRINGQADSTSGVAMTVAGGRDNVLDTASYATVGGGKGNTVTSGANYAVVSGGSGNTAGEYYSTMGGGVNNEVSGSSATVGGGQSNTSTANNTTVAGGFGNDATVKNATVGGGQTNEASAESATVAGGDTNLANAYRATVAGGYDNTASGSRAAVGGGIGNTASGGSSVVGGGDSNEASGSSTTVGGGGSNAAKDNFGTVAGGSANTAWENYGTVAGGYGNDAFADYDAIGGGSGNRTGSSGTTATLYATVPGGRDNVADGQDSFAAGRQAEARHAGTFVWADSDSSSVTSTGSDQFIVDADGGMGVGTSSPATRLHVADAISDVATVANHVAVIENSSSGGSADVLALQIGEDKSNVDAANNFVTFKDSSGDTLGAIEGDGSGGVTNASAGADYAEYLSRADSDESMEPGDVVGVHGGVISLETGNADRAMVVTRQPVVAGNDPGPEPAAREGYEQVAFVGQAAVKVRGSVDAGDLVVPSGEGDGTARAIAPAAFRPGDGPLVGRAWESTDEAGLDEVTVAVGLETGEAFGRALGDMQRTVERQHETIEDLQADNDALRERLAALEDRVGAVEAGDASGPAPADD